MSQVCPRSAQECTHWFAGGQCGEGGFGRVSPGIWDGGVPRPDGFPQRAAPPPTSLRRAAKPSPARNASVNNLLAPTRDYSTPPRSSSPAGPDRESPQRVVGMGGGSTPLPPPTQPFPCSPVPGSPAPQVALRLLPRSFRPHPAVRGVCPNSPTSLTSPFLSNGKAQVEHGVESFPC